MYHNARCDPDGNPRVRHAGYEQCYNADDLHHADVYFVHRHRLRGAVNDVSDLELSLTDQDREIKVMKFVALTTGDPNQTSPPGPETLWPTRENLTAAVNHIAQEASPDELVYFHCSCHGTLRPTANSGFTYQEDYGTDTALVLYEPNAPHGVRYLFGIELAILLEKLIKKGLRLTVVLDACHSGSISRSEDDLVRCMPWNDAVASEFPLPERPTSELLVSKESIYRDATKSPHWLLYPQEYALWAACGPHERARELRLGKERYNGCLSYHILEALDFCTRNQIPDITHEEMYQRVCAKMYSKEIWQNPVLLGTRRTTFLRPQEISRETRSTHGIIKISERDIWLNVGLIHGSCIGDEYLIYLDAKATQLVARITITDVYALHSIATKSPNSPVPPEDGNQMKVGYCAVITTLARPQAHVRLHPEVGNGLVDIVTKSMWLECLPTHERASITTLCFSVAMKDGRQYTILDSDDHPVQYLPPLPAANHPAIIITLEHLAKINFVQTLNNRRANSLLASDFSLTATSRVDAGNYLSSDDRITIPHQTLVDIEFRNLTAEVLYFAVLNITPLRRIAHVYPAHKECQFVLPSDTYKVLPRELAKDINPSSTIKFALRMTVPLRLQTQQQWKQGTAQISVKDELKFIVSTHPVYGTRAMELPNLWDAVEQGNTVVVSERDKSFGAQVCESLVDGHVDSWTLRNETALIRWASRSIKVCTVLEIDEDRASLMPPSLP